VIVAEQQMAAALADQLRASVERRHPKLTGKASVRAGGLVTWSEDGRSFAIERRGTSVVLLEQFPLRPWTGRAMPCGGPAHQPAR